MHLIPHCNHSLFQKTQHCLYYSFSTFPLVYHQGVKDLAPNFVMEAFCPHDNIPEAIRHQGDAYVAAVQWHPEFHKPALGTLDDSPILTDFLNAARVKQNA